MFRDPKKFVVKNYNKEVYREIKVVLPHSLYEELQKLGTEKGLSVAKAAVIAIDNELTESPEPLKYRMDLPEEFTDTKYVAEGNRVLTYLAKFRHYVQREMLVAARRDMGIESLDLFLATYKELLESGMIEEFLPEPFNNWRPHPNSRFVRLPEDVAKGLNAKSKVPKSFAKGREYKPTSAYRKK